MRKIMHKHCNCTNAVYGMITFICTQISIHIERKKENILTNKITGSCLDAFTNRLVLPQFSPAANNIDLALNNFLRHLCLTQSFH